MTTQAIEPDESEDARFVVRPTSISIRRRQYSNGEVDQIEVVMADLHLSAYLSSDREIRLAKRLADAWGLTVYWDDANAERCHAALQHHGNLSRAIAEAATAAAKAVQAEGAQA